MAGICPISFHPFPDRENEVKKKKDERDFWKVFDELMKDPDFRKNVEETSAEIRRENFKIVSRNNLRPKPKPRP